MNLKLKIGEFSKLAQVTVKTLRHYEEIGILIPHKVDSFTGYRFYDVDQLKEMTHIQSLKQLGFSLEEIHEMKAANMEHPTEKMINEKIRLCDQEIESLHRRRCKLQMLRTSSPKEIIMENLSITTLPEIIVASHREVLKSNKDLFTLLPNVIGPEMHRLGCTCPEPGYCYTISHDHEYRETNVDLEYCEQVNEAKADSELVQFKTVPAVDRALVYKHYGAYEDFPTSWAKLLTYIEKNGYKIIGEPRFSYIDGIWNKDTIEEWLTEIQVPIA